MEYRYSSILDPSTYETENLCDGIPLRVHMCPDLEDLGAFRAQEDWRKHVGPVDNYKGGLGPQYSFMAVSVPECIPERLEIISYANEFAFLHDDVTDNVGQTEGDEENNKMLDAFREVASTGTINAKQSGKKQIQSKMLLKMLSLDKERALTTMKAWAKFVELASGRRHHTHFATLDEYIPYRVIDVGQMFWFGVMTFGMGITIPEEESELCARLTRPAWIAAGLTNDLFSWEKEHAAARRNGQPDVVNAIWVLMGEHSITEDQAKQLCREKIKVAVADYLQVIKKHCDDTKISLDLRKYIVAMQYSLSGNVVWSLKCPRYHPDAQYNQLQLLRMKHGVAAYPGPELKITPKRPEDCGEEDSERPWKRAKTRGFPIPLSPTSEIASVLSSPGCSDVDRFDKVHEGADRAAPSPDWPVKINQSESESEDADPLVSLDLPEMGEKIVRAPYDYLSSLPSKGVRDQVIDALNVWLKAPMESIDIIKAIGHRLHNVSLMLDDFEDQSPLRRGQPSTHSIFGAAQTVNSANFEIIAALDDVTKLTSPKCLNVFIEELRCLYSGQSLDLYWTYNLACPSVPEYLKMVDKKTGGLFRLLLRLMVECSTGTSFKDLDGLAVLFGRLFQIRDDYQNLVSADYTAQKGFCEDLDEGKYSLPLIHALQSDPQDMQLRSVLVQRRIAGQCTPVHKLFILQRLDCTKSLEFTASVLDKLHSEAIRTIERVEKRFETENFSLRLLLNLLRV